MIKKFKSRYPDDPRALTVPSWFVQWDPSVGNVANLTDHFSVLADPPPPDNPDHPSTNLHERVAYVDGYGTLTYGAKFSVWGQNGGFDPGRYSDQIITIWQIEAGEWLQLGTGAVWSDFDARTLLVEIEH